MKIGKIFYPIKCHPDFVVGVVGASEKNDIGSNPIGRSALSLLKVGVNALQKVNMKRHTWLKFTSKSIKQY